MFAHEAGLAEKIIVEHQETSPTRSNSEVFASNPLGKVHVLLRPGQSSLFDSSVICRYLDTLHQMASFYPNDPERLWGALRLEALAQDMAQAGIGVRWEAERRPKHLRYPELQAGYEVKLIESYVWLERELFWEEDLHIGHIALATTLDWLVFRGLPTFRSNTSLTRWFDDFAQRPSMRATPLSGNTQD